MVPTTTKRKPAGSVAAEEPEFENRWLETFAVLIHDIESPLVSMKYLLRLLDEKKLRPQDELHQRLIKSTRIAIERAETIIYDIMFVAKAGKTGVPVTVTAVDFSPIVEEALALARGAAHEKQVALTADGSLAAVHAKVAADSHLMTRLLDNLIYNAIRHTPSGGEIKVYASEEGNSVFIHIKDSGPGLGDVDPELLFEKFGQVQMRTEGKHRGVGLGLYFCRLAATGMGGTVLADDHPDGGAVFSLRLRKAQG